jgi:uncharacterized YccA/Bax inhibitor family protein
VRSSNPVLTRLTPETQSGYAPPQAGYRPSPSYQSPVVTGVTDRMTIDDVVVRTVALLAVTGIAGALAWVLTPEPPDPALFGVWIVAAMIGLVLGLVISFKRITNPALIFAYAAVEGVFVGAVSKTYEAFASGIVVQAVVGTFGIFLLMTVLYKFRVIRSSPKFAKRLTAIVIGILLVYLVSFVLSFFGVQNPLFARNADGTGSLLAILFSLAVIVIASLTFILDFDLIEQSVAQGAPKEVAWTCAFGLLVGLIWVYLEVLRLLSYLRGRD